MDQLVRVTTALAVVAVAPTLFWPNRTPKIRNGMFSKTALHVPHSGAGTLRASFVAW
jgi:hypothetical protein